MPKKNVWESMKAGFKKKAKSSRKDFAKMTKGHGKGSIDSMMGGRVKGRGKI